MHHYCHLPAHILGKPDTLEKRTGKSIFGSHHYVVKEIKSARILITIHESKLQAAFYTLINWQIFNKDSQKNFTKSKWECGNHEIHICMMIMNTTSC